MAKRFIDCGGMLHATKHTCLLQTYVADDVDHRLTAERVVKILDLSQQVLPHDDVEVEVEYDCCVVVAQYPIASSRFSRESIELQRREKHSDCLAKSKCGIGSECETAY